MVKDLLTACLLALVTGAATGSQSQADFQLPEPSGALDAALTLWATHYFVHSAVAAPSGIAFPGPDGKALSDRVSPRDWCLGAIEGTVQAPFSTGFRTLNFSGVGSKSQVDCAAVLKIDAIKKPWITAVGRSFFKPAQGPYGDGVQGLRLVPFRTMAVDPKKVPIGTVLYVPTARGAKARLPSGEDIVHDGYFLAADQGGAIKGAHVDVFCGTASGNCLPIFITSDETKTFRAFRIADSEVIKLLRRQHGK